MNASDIIFYTTPQGEVRIEVYFEDETYWLTQKKMAELFGVEVNTINYHLKEIYKSAELQELATIRRIRIVQLEGGREVARDVEHFNLDAIIAVGYRVNSTRATKFRIWATNTLKEFIIKGFVLDDARLKQGKRFGQDYFEELLERIREIRASERRVTADTALCLSKYLGNSAKFWLGLQNDFDLEEELKGKGKELAGIPLASGKAA
ncbi:MAG TPA: RhuM family protein [Flavobacteriales bacterium]|jgi:hypothetical protein|nr:virulence RhuM family protein [Flavobacteriales bacterium]HNI04172.1 RhuM family protein [Flavobacteriales bacterium]